MSFRVGIVGANRRRNGTGPFVAGSLVRAGCDVCAVAAASLESGRLAAQSLAPLLGKMPQAFGSALDMLDGAGLDAVAICSPAAFHAEHLEAALDARLHVFCEKPLLLLEGRRHAEAARNLSRRFEAAGLVLHLNTQWPYTLREFHQLHGGFRPGGPRRLTMEMAPPVGGEDLFWESVPHPVSLLIVLGGAPEPRDVRAEWSPAEDALDLDFALPGPAGGRISARLRFRVCPTQPRPAAYSIDGAAVRREVRLDPWSLRLVADRQSVPLRDPLESSVNEFVRRVLTRDLAPTFRRLLLDNVVLLDALWQESSTVRRSSCPTRSTTTSGN